MSGKVIPGPSHSFEGAMDIIITVKGEYEKTKIINHLIEGEENGDIDFAYGCRVTDKYGTSNMNPQYGKTYE